MRPLRIGFGDPEIAGFDMVAFDRRPGDPIRSFFLARIVGSSRKRVVERSAIKWRMLAGKGIPERHGSIIDALAAW
jgi:hypothetical protein